MIAIVRYLRRSNAGLAASLWAEIERYPFRPEEILAGVHELVTEPAETEL